MVRRKALGIELVEWVGAESLELIDAASGWPSHFLAKTTSDWVKVAAYLGPIGHSQRGRGDVERRFQNPGSNRPVLQTPDEIPLLLGVYESDGTRLLVGMEVNKRIGKRTRQSLFMPLHLLRSAAHWGWAEHYSDTNERVVAFAPKLLPIYVEVQRSGVDVHPERIEDAIVASGAGDDDSGPDALDRAISSVRRLIRSATFSRDVRKAYGGYCAMCGLDFTLVEGAHIVPVAAPGSRDEVWNGLALCRNHHAAFDSFMLYVDPVSRRIRLHPEVVRQGPHSAGCKAFVESTFPTLVLPARRVDRPRDDMFVKRYEFFRPRYGWV
jgi:HNH endonuclease